MTSPDNAVLADFDEYLRRRGLLARTRKEYVRVAALAWENPIDWFSAMVANRPPVGTVQQARSAVAHLLRFRGTPETDIRGSLPPAKGKKGATREGLEADALVEFLAQAEQYPEPLRTILLLLPRTGLRISEMCTLTLSDVKSRGGVYFLSFRGKGDKPRVVPLGAEGKKVLLDFLDMRKRGKIPDTDQSLFPGRAGTIDPSTVRKACREIKDTNPDLFPDLTPHVLRHTYATRAVVSGVDLARLKSLLGHSDIKTTQRYLHPTMDDLAAAVGNVEGM